MSLCLWSLMHFSWLLASFLLCCIRKESAFSCPEDTPKNYQSIICIPRREWESKSLTKLPSLASSIFPLDASVMVSNCFYVRLSLLIARLLRGNRVMDSTLACCADGLGWIPAIDKSNMQYSDVFSPSQYKVVGKRNGARHYLHDLALPLSMNNNNNITSHAIYWPDPLLASKWIHLVDPLLTLPCIDDDNPCL